MSEKYQTVVEMLNAWWGGAVTVIIAGLAGRMMWHVGEVKAKRRKFLGPEILWELPLTAGMIIIGEAVCAYFGIEHIVMRAGVIAGLVYLGPRGAEVLIMRIINSRLPKG